MRTILFSFLSVSSTPLSQDGPKIAFVLPYLILMHFCIVDVWLFVLSLAILGFLLSWNVYLFLCCPADRIGCNFRDFESMGSGGGGDGEQFNSPDCAVEGRGGEGRRVGYSARDNDT
jgi:hypothetical protein